MIQLTNKEEVLAKATPQIIKWYAHAIAGMIVADGRVDEREIEHLKTVLSKFESKAEALDLIQAVKSKNLPELKALHLHDRTISLKILFSLVDIAVSDFELQNKEIRYLKKAADKLGFDKSFADAIHDFASGYMGVFSKMNDLRTKALTSS